jgi:tellurite resistance protein TerC
MQVRTVDYVMRTTLKRARAIAVGVIGTTILLIGVAMLALPGPGLLVIIGGLALLGTEFVWARRLLRRVKKTARNLRNGWKDRGGAKEGDTQKRDEGR